MKVLSLLMLTDGILGLTPGQGTVMAEAGTMCFDAEGHPSPITLSVAGEYSERVQIECLPITDQMRRGYRFDTQVTDQGACGVAILLIADLTGYEVIEEATRGSYFDYWLAPKDAFLFQGSARLEISGIRHGSDDEIAARARKKIGQIDQSSHRRLPGYVVIVEFSRPLVQVARR